MVERFVRDEEAAGSNPVTPTSTRAPVQAGVLSQAERLAEGQTQWRATARDGMQGRGALAAAAQSCHPGADNLGR